MADAERLQKLGLVKSGLELKSVDVGKNAAELAAEHGQDDIVALLKSADAPGGMEKIQLLAGYEARAAPEARLWQELCGAAQRGDLDDCARLVAANADVDAPNLLGERPLHLATAGGHVGILEVLLQARAKIDARSRELRRTALMVAAADGRMSAARLLVASRARLDSRNSNGLTSRQLAAAARGDDAAAVCRMLEHVEADVKAVEAIKVEVLPGYRERLAATTAARNATELRDAVRTGHAEECSRLLAARADVSLAARADASVEPRWFLEDGEWKKVQPRDSGTVSTPRSAKETLLHMATVRAHLQVCGWLSSPL